MRALIAESLAGPDGLRFGEIADPEPSGELVLIEVHAAGVGFVDLLLTQGRYQIRPEPPFVPGIEVAGVVLSGPLAAGTRVAATVPFGGFAELALAPDALCMELPDELGFEQAATLPINYGTALLALKRRGRLAAGETVLVHGAAGGVGTAAISVARALGAGRVIAVAGGEPKLAVARGAGADAAIDAAGDWVAAVRELTGGRGADVVVDPVGGERFTQSLRCMAPEGRLLVIGFASGEIPELPVNRLLLRHLDVIGVNFGGMLALDPGAARRAGTELIELCARGAIRPLAGSVHALADGADALRELESRTAVGKAVLITR